MVDEQELERRREYAWKQQIDQNITTSGVPIHTRAATLKSLASTEGNRKAFGLVRSFLEGKVVPPIALFIGIPGVGKTTLAYVIAWEYLEAGDRVLYFQAEELLNALQAVLDNGKEYGRIWDRLKAADLVVLDDIGVQNRTPWRDAQLDTLVDFRYRERLPLVMTTNKLDLSERILDRVKEGASAVITGESWRGKGAKQ